MSRFIEWDGFDPIHGIHFRGAWITIALHPFENAARARIVCCECKHVRPSETTDQIGQMSCAKRDIVGRIIEEPFGIERDIELFSYLLGRIRHQLQQPLRADMAPRSPVELALFSSHTKQ